MYIIIMLYADTEVVVEDEVVAGNGTLFGVSRYLLAHMHMCEMPVVMLFSLFIMALIYFFLSHILVLFFPFSHGDSFLFENYYCFFFSLIFLFFTLWKGDGWASGRETKRERERDKKKKIGEKKFHAKPSNCWMSWMKMIMVICCAWHNGGGSSRRRLPRTFSPHICLQSFLFRFPFRLLYAI